MPPRDPSQPNLGEAHAEAAELAEAFARSLDAVEKPGGDNPESVNELFRAAHSLKGFAALLGLHALQGIAHAAEDLLDAVRLGRARFSPELIDTLHAAAAAFASMLAAGARAREDPALVERLRRAVAASAAAGLDGSTGIAAPGDALPAGIPAEIASALTEYERHRLVVRARDGSALYVVRAELDPAEFDVQLARFSERLRAAGELIATLPGPPGPSITFDLLAALAPDVDPAPLVEGVRAQIGRIARFGDTVTRAAEPGAAGAENEGPAPGEPAERAPATVRVRLEELDRLVALSGELGVSRANLAALVESVRAVAGPAGLALDLQREVRTLDRRIARLRQGLLAARMVPLGPLFERTARAARQAARETGKELQILTAGGTTEIDRVLAEELADPLLHLVRNAVDHGLETPADREARGKLRRGTLRLEAHAQGRNVAVRVADDGRGVELDAVRRAAESRGARGLGRAELLRMLFTPGFTTRTQAGALSGRGVGLDAVDARVSRLGGLVELATEEGAGTSITLTLPATLAVQAALLVSSAGRVFALPVGQVVEVVNASERDPALKSQRLDRLLGIANGNGAGTPEPRYAIVCGPPSARAALLVDTLEGEEELVVQPLGGALRDVRGVAGAAELAGHRAAIVLDAGALAAEVAA